MPYRKTRLFRALRAPLRYVRSWRGRVWLGALCLAIVPVVALTLAQSLLQAREVAEFRRQQIVNTAADLSAVLDEHVDSHRDRMLRLASELREADFANVPAMEAAIVRAAEWTPSANSIAVADHAGRIVAISRLAERGDSYEAAPFRGAVVGDREYFLQPTRTGRTFVSRVFESRGARTGEATFFVSAPVVRDRAPRGVVFAATLAAEFARFDRQFATGLQSHIVVLDRTGRVMYASRELGLRPLAERAASPWLQALLSGQASGDVTLALNGKSAERVLYAQAATREGWIVLIVRPQLRLAQIIGKFMRDAVPIMLLALGIAVLIAHRLIAMITRPLGLILQRVETFGLEASQGHFRGIGALPPEYVRMVRRLHRMAWRLNAWQGRLRRALADAKRARSEVISVLVNREDEVRARTRELADANAALERLSRIDPLTGVANRRWFAEALDREWRAALRERTTVTLLLIDIDFYKAFNDQYGHQAGDECLQIVARALSESLYRPRDLVARYGGEEFAAIAAQVAPAESALLAERLRRAVEALAVRHEGGGPAGLLTASVGVATVVPDPARSPEWLLRMADRALYAAKRAGRNRVAVADVDGTIVVREPGTAAAVVSLPAAG